MAYKENNKTKFIKEVFKRKYEIDTSNCRCECDDILYDINVTVGEKHWDWTRKCEIILDKEIILATCPNCKAEFGVKELTPYSDPLTRK